MMDIYKKNKGHSFTGIVSYVCFMFLRSCDKIRKLGRESFSTPELSSVFFRKLNGTGSKIIFCWGTDRVETRNTYVRSRPKSQMYYDWGSLITLTWRFHFRSFHSWFLLTLLGLSMVKPPAWPCSQQACKSVGFCFSLFTNSWRKL